MGQYIDRDLAVDDDGDLQVGPGGDLKIADSAESMKQAVKFMLSTDFNEVKPQPLMGANIGSLIGNSNMQEVLEMIPVLIDQGNSYSRLLGDGDYRVTVVPIDVDQIYVSVEITGVYLNELGAPLESGTIYLEYIFPYTEEKIQALS